MTSNFGASKHMTRPLPVDFTWKSQDGLTLAGKEWRPAAAKTDRPKIPVLCLPGLSRNTRDFNDIAASLQKCGHRVIALDYRGRGASQWDSEWKNYTLPVEQGDIIRAIDKLELERFAVLGTSRGGLHALLMGQVYSADRMVAVIFNDIGPHIEISALMRIARSLERPMQYPSLDAVITDLRQSLQDQFPAFGKEDWLKLTGQLATENDGHATFDYDPALAKQLQGLDEDTPQPNLWLHYEKLTNRPVLILRGEFSDILRVETASEMIERNELAELHTVSAQGHAPMLWDIETQLTIRDFLTAL